MNEMMNNPQVMGLMQSLMNDPEVFQLIQDPTVMAKLQEMMTNPSAMMNHMGDPKIMKIVQKLQSLQMGRGATPSMGNTAAAPSAAPAAGPGAIIEIYDANKFESIIRETKNKVIVVDFTATWCGPCQRIAPTFARLAGQYADKALFLKVDGDKNKELCMSKGIKGFPTFMFFANGVLLDQFSGADPDKLQERIRTLTDQFSKKEEPCPYKHFPLKDSEQVIFKECKFELVVEGLKKANAEIAKADETNGTKLHLSEAELKDMEALAGTLNHTSSYHTSSISNSQFILIDRLLSWPADSCGSGLHFVRMMVLHPHGASHYARECETNDKTRDIIKKVIRVCTEATRPMVIELGLRALGNMFSRRALAKVIGGSHENTFDSLAVFAAHAEVKVRLAFVNLLINFAIMFRENHELYQNGKVQVLSSLGDRLVSESDKSVMYRLLVVLGTLLYQDKSCKQLAVELEFPALLAAAEARLRDDKNVVECVKELTTLLKSAE